MIRSAVPRFVARGTRWTLHTRSSARISGSWGWAHSGSTKKKHDVDGARRHPRRDLRVSPFGPAQQLFDVETDLVSNEPRRVSRGDQVELGQRLPVEGRPRDEVDLLVVMSDQGEPAGPESVSSRARGVSGRSGPLAETCRASSRLGRGFSVQSHEANGHLPFPGEHADESNRLAFGKPDTMPQLTRAQWSTACQAR
jgi:hypothetical protein